MGTSPIKLDRRTYFRALGKRITELRKGLGMTQAELARTLGVSQQTVFAYELGDRRVSVLTLCTLARLFDVPVEQLMGMAQLQLVSQQPSRKWMHHAQRMQGLSKTAQRFIIKLIDLLEQDKEARASIERSKPQVVGETDGMTEHDRLTDG
jgi:transcriptional regulator with XRE-family HTH domain